MPMKSTKTRILDAAEKIIAGHGAEKATLRSITAEAGVNLAAINYHFGSKDALLDELFARRVGPMEDARVRRLQAATAEAGEDGPELETIIRCYLEPFLDFVEQHPDHNHFLAQLHRPSDSWKRFIQKHQSLVQPVLGRFFEALSRALPNIPRSTLLARMAFMQASVSWLLNNAWIAWEMQALFQLSLSQRDMIEELVSYTAAGLRGEGTGSPTVFRARKEGRG